MLFTISGLITAHIVPAAAIKAPIAAPIEIALTTPTTSSKTSPTVVRIQTFRRSRPADKLEIGMTQPVVIKAIVMKAIPEEIDVDTELGNLQIRQQAGNPHKTPPIIPKRIERITPIESGDSKSGDSKSGDSKSGDSDFGELRVKPEADDEDNDFTGLQIRQSAPIPPIPPTLPAPPAKPPAPPAKPPAKPKWLSIAAWFNQINNSNAFSATDYKFDQAIRSGLTLSAIPALGPKTYLIGGVDGVITRYTKFPIKYDELRLRLGIWQQLTARSYGEIGWTNQKLYLAKDGLRNILSGDQFTDENTIRFDLGRTDPLTKALSWSSLYQFRQIFSDREEKNRSNHNFSTSLNYQVSPSWNAGLDYYLSWAHYTNVNRDDIYQSVQLRTSYAFNPRVQTNLFGGFNFGGSTEDGNNLGFGASGREKLQYDGWFFGVGLSFNTPLF